ncbi:hypothetical protein BKA63DRAFT_491939 [Paraphoma chrysanthemicola]|nr:hypothetical protein BKA63DRAFT_491939 [Paraphoma chrysanthemicola]
MAMPDDIPRARAHTQSPSDGRIKEVEEQQLELAELESECANTAHADPLEKLAAFEQSTAELSTLLSQTLGEKMKLDTVASQLCKQSAIELNALVRSALGENAKLDTTVAQLVNELAEMQAQLLEGLDGQDSQVIDDDLDVQAAQLLNESPSPSPPLLPLSPAGFQTASSSENLEHIRQPPSGPSPSGVDRREPAMIESELAEQQLADSHAAPADSLEKLARKDAQLKTELLLQNAQVKKRLTELELKNARLNDDLAAEKEKTAQVMRDERLIRMSERHALLKDYLTVIRREQVLFKAQEELNRDEAAFRVQKADLDSREEQLKTAVAALARDNPFKKDRTAELDHAFANGKKHISTVIEAKAAQVKLELDKAKRQALAERDHHSMIFEKMKRYAEDPEQWHIKVRELEEIVARKASQESNDPAAQSAPPLSPEEARFARVVANRVTLAQNETLFDTIKSVSGRLFIEKGLIHKQYVGDFFVQDWKDSRHMGKRGEEVGRHIQWGIMYHREGWSDPDFHLSRRGWTEADLQCPADMTKLPFELLCFWEGVKASAERASREFKNGVEKRPRPRS